MPPKQTGPRQRRPNHWRDGRPHGMCTLQLGVSPTNERLKLEARRHSGMLHSRRRGHPQAPWEPNHPVHVRNGGAGPPLLRGALLRQRPAIEENGSDPPSPRAALRTRSPGPGTFGQDRAAGPAREISDAKASNPDFVNSEKRLRIPAHSRSFESNPTAQFSSAGDARHHGDRTCARPTPSPCGAIQAVHRRGPVGSPLPARDPPRGSRIQQRLSRKSGRLGEAPEPKPETQTAPGPRGKNDELEVENKTQTYHQRAHTEKPHLARLDPASCTWLVQLSLHRMRWRLAVLIHALVPRTSPFFLPLYLRPMFTRTSEPPRAASTPLPAGLGDR